MGPEFDQIAREVARCRRCRDLAVRQDQVPVLNADQVVEPGCFVMSQDQVLQHECAAVELDQAIRRSSAAEATRLGGPDGRDRLDENLEPQSRQPA